MLRTPSRFSFIVCVCGVRAAAMSSDAGDGADYNALLVCLKGTTFGNELKAQAVREFA